MKIKQFTIGIDEVGRGPLAGPVVVCALAIPRGLSLREPTVVGSRQSYLPLRDSKKLSAAQRERWFAWIKKHPAISYAVSRVYPRGIERLNISQAANLAATRAFIKLYGQSLPERSARKRRVEGVPYGSPSTGSGTIIKVLLDGGLYLRASEVSRFKFQVSCRTIIKGDEKIPVIALASIVAKVTRDRFMDKLHKKYPQYGFDEHKGYGTKAHYAALKKYGATEAHRATFIGKMLIADDARMPRIADSA